MLIARPFGRVIGLVLLLVSGTASSEPRLLADPVLDILVPFSLDDTRGGLIAADVDGDDVLEFVLTGPGSVAAIRQDGAILWEHVIDVQVSSRSERNGLPGHHGPGVQVTDVFGSGVPSVLYLTRAGRLRVVRGADGEVLEELEISPPSGAERWEHLVVANFRGAGDRDLLLQATNVDGYRVGRFIAAFAIDQLVDDKAPEPLWERDDFLAAAHGGARVADLDGDGLDEVFSGSIIGPTGRKLYEIPLRGHVDAMVAADVDPDRPGLEVVALEEGGGKWFDGDNFISEGLHELLSWFSPRRNRIFVFDEEGLVWSSAHEAREPQNTAVGRFNPDDPGVYIWNRSRYDVDQRPFVFDAAGDLAAEYELSKTAPEGWDRAGVEVISPIYWSGGAVQQIAAKERHKDGDVALLDPLSGRFLLRIPEQASRLYVADVLGDWREEIVVLAGPRLRVYANPDANPRPDQPRLWESQHYRRLKQTWNYYSAG